MPIAFLLALQASGMIVDYLGTRDQIRMAKLGQQLEEASINSSLASTRLESVDASQNAMKELRQNMGTQAAMFAARGTRANAGSSIGIKNESISNFNSDERMRHMNLAGREAALKAGLTISKLHGFANKQEQWKGFRGRTMNTISSNPGVYASAFGSTGSGGKSTFQGSTSRASGSFGMNTIGG